MIPVLFVASELDRDVLERERLITATPDVEHHLDFRLSTAWGREFYDAALKGKVGAFWVRDVDRLDPGDRAKLTSHFDASKAKAVFVFVSQKSVNVNAMREAADLIGSLALRRRLGWFSLKQIAICEGAEPIYDDCDLLEWTSTEECVSEVRRALSVIGEKYKSGPQVGVGLLLVNKAGEFFLTERVLSDRRRVGGTIGGTLKPGETPEAWLHDRVCKCFVNPGGFEVGPLLACTNMKGNGTPRSHVTEHYVDLTFFATVDEVKLADGYKRTLAPYRNRKFWFSLAEMKTMYKNNELFTPVAHAFERLCAITVQQIISPGSAPIMAHAFTDAGLSAFCKTIDASELAKMISVSLERNSSRPRNGSSASSPVFFEA